MQKIGFSIQHIVSNIYLLSLKIKLTKGRVFSAWRWFLKGLKTRWVFSSGFKYLGGRAMEPPKEFCASLLNFSCLLPLFISLWLLGNIKGKCQWIWIHSSVLFGHLFGVSWLGNKSWIQKIESFDDYCDGNIRIFFSITSFFFQQSFIFLWNLLDFGFLWQCGSEHWCFSHAFQFKIYLSKVYVTHVVWCSHNCICISLRESN